MKRTLIIMCLFFTANSWADDEEFPIELTCELGNLIVYYNITDNPETTWWQNHSSNRHKLKTFWNYETNKNKNQVKELEINKENIYLLTRKRATTLHTYINRVTGYANINANINNHHLSTLSGQCTKGFKNYEKNVF